MAAVIKIKSTAATGTLTSANTTAPTQLALGELAFSFGNQVLAIGSGLVGNATGNSLDSTTGRINRIVGGSAFFDQTAATFGKTGMGDNVLANTPTLVTPWINHIRSTTGTSAAIVKIEPNNASSPASEYGTAVIAGNFTVFGASTFSYNSGISFLDSDTIPNPSYTIRPTPLVADIDVPTTIYIPSIGGALIATFTVATGGVTNDSTLPIVSITSVAIPVNSIIIGAGIPPGTLIGTAVTAGTITSLTLSINVTVAAGTVCSVYPSGDTFATLAATQTFTNKTISGSGSSWNGSTITVPHGGTGVGTFTANGVLYGNGTSAISATAGGANTVLTGTATAPSFSSTPTLGRLTLTEVAAAAGTALTVSPANHTAVTTDSPAFSVASNAIGTTGIATAQRFSRFTAGTFTGSGTVATAATVAISGAPTATGAAITNSYALWVEAGDVLFKGLIKAGSSTTTLTDAAGKIVTAALNTVGVAQGGTGATTLATNGVLYGNGTNTISAIAGTSAQVLIANASGVPTWGAIALASTSAVSGLLQPSNGGTGANNAGRLTVAANVSFSGGSSGFTTTFALPTASDMTFTLPTATSTLATVGLTETLTNKTLTTPTIATINGVTAINGITTSNLVITAGTGKQIQFAGEAGYPVVFSASTAFDSSVNTFTYTGGGNPTVSTPTTGVDLTANHLVHRGYVDAVVQGLHMHAPADVILNAGNISSDSATNGVTGARTTAYSGNTITITATSGFLTMTVDQEAITLWTRIIINFTDASQQIYNGIYSKAMTPSNGVNVTVITLTRAADADVIADINGGDFILIQNGYTFKECGFVQSITPGTGSNVLSNTAGVGTFKPVFVQFSQAGVIEAGAGLTKTGIRVDVVGTLDRISVAADSIDIASGYVGQSSITTLGNVVTGTIDGGTF